MHNVEKLIVLWPRDCYLSKGSCFWLRHGALSLLAGDWGWMCVSPLRCTSSLCWLSLWGPFIVCRFVMLSPKACVSSILVLILVCIHVFSRDWSTESSCLQCSVLMFPWITVQLGYWIGQVSWGKVLCDEVTYLHAFCYSLRVGRELFKQLHVCLLYSYTFIKILK